MRALLQDRYGAPELLRIGDIEKPSPADDQVLVRVRAASVNAGDWRQVRGNPFLIRMLGGLRRPRDPLFGGDAAGVVESIGKDVADLHAGDEVFGIRTGAFAEYVAGKNFVPKPANLTLEEAAAVPIAAITALQALRDHGELQAGQRVLINGAGGGVGSFAVQLAKALGADVTATTSAQSLDLVRSLGADRLIDYTTEDFRSFGPYDLVVDLGGTPSISRLRTALTADGVLVLVAAAKGGLGVMPRIGAGAFRRRVLKQRVRFFVADVRKEDLLFLKELIEAGKVRPVIDRIYPFADAPAAIRCVEEGRARGKVVIAF